MSLRNARCNSKDHKPTFKYYEREITDTKQTSCVCFVQVSVSTTAFRSQMAKSVFVFHTRVLLDRNRIIMQEGLGPLDGRTRLPIIVSDKCNYVVS